MIRRSLVIVFFGAFLALASSAFAQIAGSDISISVSPNHPNPQQLVTVTIQSYSTNIQAAEITWTLDGKLVLGGIGKSTYSFTAKSAGIQSILAITVTPPGGVPISKQLAITPTGMDLLWQATDSIVPPLYRGKALPSPEGTVRFVAMPQIKTVNGTTISPGDLIYSWDRNYSADQADSGYGKNSFTVQTDYLNPSEHIGVNADSREGDIGAEASTDTSTSTPAIVWYAASPLYGPQFDHALITDYAVSGSDTSILAEPYFFSAGDLSSTDLTYAWKLNDVALATPNIPNSLFLHRDTTTQGDATLDLSITSVTKLFQQATAHLTLHLQ